MMRGSSLVVQHAYSGMSDASRGRYPRHQRGRLIKAGPHTWAGKHRRNSANFTQTGIIAEVSIGMGEARKVGF